MVSYQDEAILADCLASIRNQKYDQKLIQIIIVDGGSADKTLEIAKKYGAITISRPDLKNYQNKRGKIALKQANGDLMLFFSADNRFQEPDILTKMVTILADKKIAGCETLRYAYRRTDPVLSRYFALIGGCDPVGIGLGKADRGPYDTKRWHSFGEVKDCGDYYRVKFKPDIAKIPSLGANGFLIKRELVEKTDFKKTIAHIDMCVSLIQQGYDAFAFLKNRHVVHYITTNPIPFLKRRLFLADMYSAEKTERVYKVFHWKDTGKLIWLIFTNLTLVFPLLRAVKGLFYVPDPAWFLHPVMCFVFTLGYGWFFYKKWFLVPKQKLKKKISK